MDGRFSSIVAINMIPASGEFTYDTVPYQAMAPLDSVYKPINCYFAPGSGKTDFCYALDQLQVQCPNCQWVALVVQWMGNSLDGSQCQVYPSTINWVGSDVGAFQPVAGGVESWCVSDLTLADCNHGLIPVSRPDGVNASYGGTCSDQSVVRAIREIRRRGLKICLYLMMNLDVPGQPWRGLCSYAPEKSSATVSAINHFLGNASAGQFSRDPGAMTVHYSGGSKFDFSYRRFALHYAHLAVVAGGVNLLTFGSELRGMEMLRGPNWTPQGSLDANGFATWDYPFVAGLISLLQECRKVFDGAGFSSDRTNRNNLIVYSADWSQWTGAQHADVAGIFPHLDALYACAQNDFVSIDNYLPISDWTSGDGGLDAQNWRLPRSMDWPNPNPQTLGFGLDGTPDIHDIRYLQANIEHGEKYDYWYGNYDSSNRLDPRGSAQIVTAPHGDRLAQARNRYFPGQELFAQKKLRWWWKNQHRAVYDAGDGQGVAPHGAATAWVPQSKSLMFQEYGFGAIDRDTNQDNLFFNPGSVAGGAPFWSRWQSSTGGALAPVQDISLQYAALQAFYSYWMQNNEISGAGLPLIASDLMFAWNWDARPFPTFPNRQDIWADGSNWRVGMWLNGKFPYMPPRPASPSPSIGAFPSFPILSVLSWDRVVRPRFLTQVAARGSGRESRVACRNSPIFDIELVYDFLRSDQAHAELQSILDFFGSVQGKSSPFWVTPPGLEMASAVLLGTGDGQTESFAFRDSLGGVSGQAQGVSSVQSVYLNGAAQSVDAYQISAGYAPKLVFATPPAAGTIVSADYRLLWLCRFAEDIVDFDSFASALWSLRTVKLQTTRP